MGAFESLLGALLLAWLLVAPVATAQGIEGETLQDTPPPLAGNDLVEEDLIDTESEDFPGQDSARATSRETGELPTLTDEVVIALFSEAEATFSSIDRPASLSQLSQLIDLVETHLDETSRVAMALAAEEEAMAAAAAREEAAEITLPIGPVTPDGEEPATENAGGESAQEEGSGGVEDGGEKGGEENALTPPDPPAEVAFLGPTQRSLFARALALRATLYDELGEPELADLDLGRMLRVDPTADLEAAEPSRELGQRFERLRKQQVGELSFAIEPPDAVIHVDGRKVLAGTGELHTTLAGDLLVAVERPGYRTVVEPVELRGGRRRTVELTLERESAILRLSTRPSGATVLLDGVPLGTTEGVASADSLPATGTYRSEEFSSELVIDPVPLGLRVLEVSRQGYRTYRAELMIDDLLDYPIPPIVLEDERGVLVFRDLPPDSRVRIDGRERALENPGSSLPRLTLPPGEYEVAVASGRAKMFSTRLLLADRQTLDVRVKLRPGISYLGLLGGDAQTTRDFDRSLRRVFGDASSWALLDRSDEGPQILAEAGAERGALLEALDGGNLDGLDWQQIQWSADQRAPGAVYVAVVLSETLVERRTRMLVWSAAPGPSRPEIIELPIGDASALEALGRRFDRDIPMRRAWVGALVMDTLASPHPVVAAVTPGSAAEAAGLRVGDAVVAVSRVPIFSRADFDRRVTSAEIGEVVDVGVQGSDGARSLRLELRPGPVSLEVDDPELLPAVAFTRLLQLAEEVAPRDRWLIQLDQALLLIDSRQWEDAVRLLRSLDAPQTSHGFGKAAADYWLGLALSNLGSEYRDAARQAFERAARLTEARLEHNDGPWVAPRARARLHLLGVGGE